MAAVTATEPFGWDEGREPDEVLYGVLGSGPSESSSACKLSNEEGSARLVVSAAPIPAGVQCFEIKVKGLAEHMLIGVTSDPALDCAGSMEASERCWAYDSRGSLRCAGAEGGVGRAKFRAGDTVTVLIDTERPFALVYKNGKLVGELNDLAVGAAFHVACEMEYRGDSVALRQVPPTKKHLADLCSDAAGGSAASGAWVEVVGAHTSALQLRWGFKDDGGSAVTRQFLTVSCDGGVSWQKPVAVGRARQGRVEHLTPNTAYTVRLRGRNGAGWSEWGEAAPGRTLAPTRAPAPQLTTENLSASEYAVSWALPDSGGAPLISFHLQTAVGREAEVWHWGERVTLDPHATRHELRVDGLRAFFHYGVRVRAVTRAGAGEWGVLDLTTQDFQVGEEVLFWWGGPWMAHGEWHEGTVEGVLEGAAVEAHLRAQEAAAAEELTARTARQTALVAAGSRVLDGAVVLGKGGQDVCTGMKPFRNMGGKSWRAARPAKGGALGVSMFETAPGAALGTSCASASARGGLRSLGDSLASIEASVAAGASTSFAEAAGMPFDSLELAGIEVTRRAAARSFGARWQNGDTSQVVGSECPAPANGTEESWWQPEEQVDAPPRQFDGSRWHRGFLYRVRSHAHPEHAPLVRFESLRQKGTIGTASIHSGVAHLDRVQQGFVPGSNCAPAAMTGDDHLTL